MQSHMKPSEQSGAHGVAADAALAISGDAMSTNTSSRHVSERPAKLQCLAKTKAGTV